MKSMKVRITFTEPVLGTAPSEEEIYRDYIVPNREKESGKPLTSEEIDDELEGLPDEPLKGKTVFHRLPDGTPYLYDYQIKGFFKDACSMLSRVVEKEEKEGDGDDKKTKKKKALNESGKLTAHKKVIDGLIFVFPRRIMLNIPEGGKVRDTCRPLRAQTPKGERVALSYSEEVPEGSYIDIEIRCLSDSHMKAVKEWLDYGILRGIGQWRNSGMGRFEWKEIQ